MSSLPIGWIVAVVDIALIVHAARTGRFTPWGFVILFLPGIGALAYIVVELVPEWLGSTRTRRAGSRIVGALDPGRRYRQLTDELAIVDTIANRAALAEACLALGKFEEARAQYVAILAAPQGDEPSFMLGRARAEFGLGEPAMAVATLDELKARWPDTRSPEGHLLYAKALEGAGRDEEALAAYEAVGAYYPGAEPRVVIGRLDSHALQHAVAEDARRPIGGVGHQQMVAGADRAQQRQRDRRHAGRDEHGSRCAGDRGPGFAQRVGGRRAVRAVSVSLVLAVERLGIGEEHRRAAVRRHVDESLRRFAVAAEMDETRTAAQAGFCFRAEVFHCVGGTGLTFLSAAASR